MQQNKCKNVLGLGIAYHSPSWPRFVSVKVFQMLYVFTPRRWTFHERVNTDEHDNVRDRLKKLLQQL